jgi:hypothetical protein
MSWLKITANIEPSAKSKMKILDFLPEKKTELEKVRRQRISWGTPIPCGEDLVSYQFYLIIRTVVPFLSLVRYSDSTKYF